MDLLALLVACLSAVGAAWVDRRSSERFEGADTALTPGYDDAPLLAALAHHDDRIDALRGELQSLAERVNDQTLAISEGIERVDRAERRVRSAVGRARARMAELGYTDDALEAEAESLRDFDAGRGHPEGVPAVQQDMGGAPVRDMSAFPGDWS